MRALCSLQGQHAQKNHIIDGPACNSLKKDYEIDYRSCSGLVLDFDPVMRSEIKIKLTRLDTDWTRQYDKYLVQFSLSEILTKINDMEIFVPNICHIALSSQCRVESVQPVRLL